jgi:hypothetical protein
MFTSQVDTSSALRWWASTRASGTIRATTTASASIECHTVVHICSGMEPDRTRVAESVSHSIRLVGSSAASRVARVMTPAAGPTG